MTRNTLGTVHGRDLSIESALAGAVSLIENAIARHRHADEDHALVELVSGDEAVDAAFLGVIDGARREIGCISTPENLSDPVLKALSDLQNESRPGLSPTDVRILFHLPTLAGHRRLQGLLGRVVESIEMRVTEAALQELIVADRRVALLTSRAGSAATRQAIVVRSPIILRAMHGLFVQSWTAASPISVFAKFSDYRQSQTARQILTLLRDGHKDDTAARELGMSVRTYRRHVADIMRDINATSRFQAGVRAAELKLLAADQVH